MTTKEKAEAYAYDNIDHETSKWVLIRDAFLAGTKDSDECLPALCPKHAATGIIKVSRLSTPYCVICTVIQIERECCIQAIQKRDDDGKES